MPIYVYRLPNGTEVEEFFVSWRDAPQEIEVDGGVARRVPARFATHFVNQDVKAAAKQGYVPLERGMKEAARRARQQAEQKQERARHEAVAAAMNQSGIEFSL